jgi:hypothetical protein
MRPATPHLPRRRIAAIVPREARDGKAYERLSVSAAQAVVAAAARACAAAIMFA